MAMDAQNQARKPAWARTRRERKNEERADKGLPPKKSLWWVWLLVIIAVIAGAAFWYKGLGGAEIMAARQAENAAAEEAAKAEALAARQAERDAEVTVVQLLPSEIATLAPGLLRETAKVTGALSPVRALDIPAEVTGLVDEVTVQEGDRVEAGQLLVQMDIETLEDTLTQQQASAEATGAQLRLAQDQLARTQNLVDRGLSPATDLESAQATVDQLAASLRALEQAVISAERALDHATVTAPFAGVVSARSVEPGAYVGTGTPLVSLVDLSEMEFEATLPLSYAPQVAPGQMVELKVDGLTDRMITGRVARIAPVAISGTRMLPIYVTIDNTDGILRGGMFASGALVLEEADGRIGIPAEILREDNDGAYVLVVVGDLLERRPVEVARSWDGGRVYEIASGLEAGDVIVSKAMSSLRAGIQIEMIGE